MSSIGWVIRTVQSLGTQNRCASGNSEKLAKASTNSNYFKTVRFGSTASVKGECTIRSGKSPNRVPQSSIFTCDTSSLFWNFRVSSFPHNIFQTIHSWFRFRSA